MAPTSDKSGKDEKTLKEKKGLTDNSEKRSKGKNHSSDHRATDAKQEKIKKRKKREVEVPVNQSRHSSATNTAPDAGEGVVNAGVEETSEEKRERRKKRKTSGPDEGASARVKKEKKKRRRKTDDDLDRADSQAELPDPSADEGLSEKARNALLYARKKATESEDWKFNKALQNWLVKHFWSENIPDKYVTIVTKYLCGCQGAVRNGLIEGCRRVLYARTPVEETAPLEANDPVDGTEKTSGLQNRPFRIPITDVSRARAEHLLAILEK